jgi:hypothetical protein
MKMIGSSPRPLEEESKNCSGLFPPPAEKECRETLDVAASTAQPVPEGAGWEGDHEHR